jgi:hypothetical protein
MKKMLIAVIVVMITSVKAFSQTDSAIIVNHVEKELASRLSEAAASQEKGNKIEFVDYQGDSTVKVEFSGKKDIGNAGAGNSTIKSRVTYSEFRDGKKEKERSMRVLLSYYIPCTNHNPQHIMNEANPQPGCKWGEAVITNRTIRK